MQNRKGVKNLEKTGEVDVIRSGQKNDIARRRIRKRISSEPPDKTNPNRNVADKKEEILIPNTVGVILNSLQRQLSNWRLTKS